MWRGWQGRAKAWLHTRVGRTQSGSGIPHLSSPLPVNLTCSLPWSKCPAASEIVNVAQVRLEGSSSLGLGLWSSRGVIIPPDVQPENA